jgi:hypothetical protein
MWKKIVLAVVLAADIVMADAFCDGWEAGYTEGYCYARGTYSCMGPIVPICPIPYLGRDGYNDGYNRGFLAGLSGGRR